MRLPFFALLAVLVTGCGKPQDPVPAKAAPVDTPAGPSAATPEGASRAFHQALARRDGLAAWDLLHSASRRDASEPTAGMFTAAKKSPELSAKGGQLLGISADQFRALTPEEFARRLFAKTAADPRNDTDGRTESLAAKWDAPAVQGDRAEIRGGTPDGGEIWEVFLKEGSEWRLHLEETEKLIAAKAELRPAVEPKTSPKEAWEELQATLLKSDVRSAVLMVSAGSKRQFADQVHRDFAGFTMLPEAAQKRLAADIGSKLDDFLAMTLKEYVYKLLTKVFQDMCADQDFRDELARFKKSSQHRKGSVAVVTAIADGELKPKKWVFVNERGEWKLDLVATMKQGDR